MQQFQAFRCYLCGRLSHACDVTARSAQATDEAEPDRVGGRFEDDRNNGGGRFCREGCRRAARREHGHLSLHQISCHCRQSVVVPLRPSEFDLDVLALDQTRFTQAFPKRCHTIRVGLRRPGSEETDHRHRRLLRARGERPGGRAAQKRDEVAPLHCPMLPVLAIERIAHLATA